MDFRKPSSEEENKFAGEDASLAKEAVSYLNITIGTDILTKSSHSLIDLLKDCVGRVSFEIKIPREDNTIRVRLDQLQEQLQKDQSIQFHIEQAKGQNEAHLKSSLPPLESNNKSEEGKAVPGVREIKFGATSDVVILYAWADIWTEIVNFVKNCKAELSILAEGLLLQGSDEGLLDKAEDYIKQCHNSIIPIKMLQGDPLEKINAVGYAFKNIKRILAKKANLQYVFTLTSNQYYQAYKDVSRKVPELADRLTEEKLKRTSLRLILNRKEIRQDPNIRQEFRKVLAENALPFKEVIRIESNEVLSQEDLREVKNLSAKSNLYLTYEPNKVLSGEKTVVVQQIVLMTYYSKESEKSELMRTANTLKQTIIGTVQPLLMYEFVWPTDSLKYDKFVRPEIQDALKEKKVSIAIVRKDGPRNGPSNLALKIQGNRREAEKMKELIANLMKQIKFQTYYVNVKSKHVMSELIKQENDYFFLSYFEQVYKHYPNMKLIKALKKGSLAIDILFKDGKELQELMKAFDHDFSELTSKLQPVLDSSFGDFLSKRGLSLKEFKKTHGIIVNEFFDNKSRKHRTAIIGEPLCVQAASQAIENLFESAKPVTVNIDIPSRLLQKALRKEERNLIPKEISCQISGYSLAISGDASKVPEIQKTIETFLKNKEGEVCEAELPKIPSSHLKAIQNKEKWFAELQEEKEVEICLLKPQSAKLNFRMGLQNSAGKRLILVQGDIAKIQVDAIVNSTNLLFNDATIIQGVAKSILDKAGEEYVEECSSHGELKETQVFVSKSGHLKTCKSIINVCPPLYESDQGLSQTLKRLKEAVFNVLKESRYDFKTIAIPFLSAGSYGIPSKEAIECLIEELAKDLFFVKSQLERIFICEVDENKLKLAESKLRSLDPAQQQQATQEKSTKHQWQWLDDGKIWKDYDLEASRKIDDAFSQNQKSVEIKFPASRSIGSHTVDLINKILVRKSTKGISKIKRMHDGWYENGVQLSSEISEIIDLKESQHQKVFDIFLNEYVVDLKNLFQLNKQTGFARRIRKIDIPLNNQRPQSRFVITGVSLIDHSKLMNDDIFGKIILKAFSKARILEAKDELEQFIQKLMIQTELEIAQNVGQENLKYIKMEMHKHLIEVQGEVKPGSKIKIRGIRSVVNKIQDIMKTIKLAQPQEVLLPDNWTKMNDHFELVHIQAQSTEWNHVFGKFSKTLQHRNVRKISRIQNTKFWRDYCQEKETLKKIREKSGISPNITEDWLWHGTRTTHPKVIYEGMEECFDIQYANHGSWGRGLYFAVNASYSERYAFSTNSGTKMMMLCRVMIGDSITLNVDGNLIKPPERTDLRNKDITFTYESVKGQSNGSEIYILYRMRRAYPEYLIEFV